MVCCVKVTKDSFLKMEIGAVLRFLALIGIIFVFSLSGPQELFTSKRAKLLRTPSPGKRMNQMATKIGNVVYVLVYFLTQEGGMTWCKATIVQYWGNRYALDFADGSRIGVFPKNEVYSQPDLKKCSKVQS
jgi:hypothetical protein